MVLIRHSPQILDLTWSERGCPFFNRTTLASLKPLERSNLQCARFFEMLKDHFLACFAKFFSCDCIGSVTFRANLVDC
jgi:hypothetical protein